MLAPTTVPTLHPRTVGTTLRVANRTAINLLKVKIQSLTPPFYVLTFCGLPIFSLILTALIYRENDALRDYAVIAGAGTSFLFIMLFSGGENLEAERQRGTLASLFIAPASRLSWLLGFQLSAAYEAIFVALVTVSLGVAIFGTPVSINPLSLAVTILLMVVCLWGLGMVLSAIGTAIRAANQLSNMLFGILTPLSGSLFPISEAPAWLRIPARCLPFGYAIEALVGAITRDASVVALRGDLLPLLGFAIGLPILGAAAFRLLDRYARRQGHLDMV
ncbi:MAG: ABC transporter permease [Thermomicrobiales bacterium]